MNHSLHIDHTSPIGQLARRHPALIDLFERLEIDYASKGGRPLCDAAAAAGHDAEELLQQVRRDAGPPTPDCTLPELLQSITTLHHHLATDQVHQIMRHLDSVASPHGEIARIRRIFANLTRAVVGHMVREERHLFPPIEDLHVHPHRVRAGSMSRPLLAEIVEHDMLHEELLTIRNLVLRLRAAHAADEQLQGLLEMLDAFDRDCHQHMHLETNVLIPRVVEMENELKTTRREQLVGS